MDFTLNQPLSIDVNKITHRETKKNTHTHTATHDEHAHQTAVPNYSM